MIQEAKTILAVGSIAIDTLQTPNGNRDNIIGGSATYFSLAAGLLAPVKLVGVVGKDFPEIGWNLFKSRNINTDNIQIVDGKTFRWGGCYNYDYSSRKTLFTELGVFEKFSPNILNNDRKSPLVFLGNIHPDLQIDVAKKTISPKYIVSDTMNLWIDISSEKLYKVLAVSKIFLLNHEEAFQFTEVRDIQEAAIKLRAAGPDVVVIKMGADGAYLSFEGGNFFIPVYPVKKVIDPTGAGDSFAGGLMGYLANTNNPDFIDAVITGSAMASFGIEDFGPSSLLNVTKKNLDERIAVIKNYMFELDGA